MEYEIINMTKDHWSQVRKIYCDGIKTGIATFQSIVPTYEEWDSGHLKICRLIACKGNEVLGWVALSPTSSRCVYSGAVEVSIYISKDVKGQGIGESLMTTLIQRAQENNIWSLYSSIIRDNIASIELHKKCGFRVVGIREKIAKLKDGRWSDTVIMEFRSKTVGID